MAAQRLRSLRLARDGAQYYADVLAGAEVERLHAVADAALNERPGRRVGCCASALLSFLTQDGVVRRLASKHLGKRARPVRLVFFDKTATNNWAVAWHQDRTIAVEARALRSGWLRTMERQRRNLACSAADRDP